MDPGWTVDTKTVKVKSNEIRTIHDLGYHVLLGEVAP